MGNVKVRRKEVGVQKTVWTPPSPCAKKSTYFHSWIHGASCLLPEELLSLSELYYLQTIKIPAKFISQCCVRSKQTSQSMTPFFRSFPEYRDKGWVDEGAQVGRRKVSRDEGAMGSSNERETDTREDKPAT